MSKSIKSSSDILCAAISLFEQAGYSQTSMRQIAAESNVSLGLINHHFTSKSRLGEITLNLIASMISSTSHKLITPDEDPILFDAVVTRTTNYYLMNSIYRKFYIDCLVEDIFWGFLNERPIGTLHRIAETESLPNLNEDELNLYAKFLPYSIEKTLILNKETGLFPSIPYEAVPDYIIRTELERFVNAFKLNNALEHSKKYTEEILKMLPVHLSPEYIRDTFENHYIIPEV